MIERRADWYAALSAFLTENKDRPFRWGSWDCCLFACNTIREITGQDVAAKYRGKYHTMLGAFRIIGGTVRTVASEVALTYGFEKHPSVQDARPGDVVLASIDGSETLGVISLARTMIFATTTGLAAYPLSLARDVWKIG